jgi:protoporphyrinogen oxidase
MSHYDVVILGAGPSGLVAAYCLGKAGAKVIVLERNAEAGGLMRSVKRGDFALDLGRKEMYSRFPEVDLLWHDLLGHDYRPYAHRAGILYNGRLIDKEAGPQGQSRGMTGVQMLGMSLSYLWSQVKPGPRVPQNLEDYYALRYGRWVYDTFYSGYINKFEGVPARSLPAPNGQRPVKRFEFITDKLGHPHSSEEVFRKEWRHPSRGTGQLVDALETHARHYGVEFIFNAEVLALNVDESADSGRVRSVSIRRDGDVWELSAPAVITSIPLPVLMTLMRPAPPPELLQPPQRETAFKKSTALVYLMASGAPLFPHNWIEVTDMSFKMGRVVNYATWNGTMVPQDKTALCIEYFTLQGAGIMEQSKNALLEFATEEAVRANLIDRSKIFDHLVLQLPHANATTVVDDWQLPWMIKASRYIRSFSGLYETNRPGVDRAALAGIDAAKACLSGKPMEQRSLQCEE